MALDEGVAVASRDQYIRERDRYQKLARYVGEECTSLVGKHRIPATVQYRAKEPDSLYEKLMRYVSEDSEKVPMISAPTDVFCLVGDLAGVRVGTYVEGDRERVVELIRDRFVLATKADGSEDIDHHEKDSGYRATHCQVLLPPDLATSPDAYNIATTSCEIQVCSMLAHVWNEIEHDIRYKLGPIDETNPLENSLLQELRRRTLDGDNIVEQLLMERSRRLGLLMFDDLAALFPSSPSFALKSDDVLREMVRLGYDTVPRVQEGLLLGDYETRARTIINTINSALIGEGKPAQCLNPETADALFALLLAEHSRDMYALHYIEIASGHCTGVPAIVDFVTSHGIL